MVRKEKKPAANNSAEGRARKRERKAKVLEMLLSGIPYTDIRNRCAEEFGVSLRTVELYIQEVRKDIPSMYSLGERKLATAEAIGKAERLYAKSLVAKDLKTALGTLKWLGELHGVHGTMQVARFNAQAQDRLLSLRARPDANDSDGDKKHKSLSLESYNETRAVGGLPPWTVEQWELFQASGKSTDN
jgi:hypothetical protein